MFLSETTVALPRCNSDKIGLKSVFSKYVVAERNGHANANRDKLDMWEQFFVEKKGNNKFAFKSHHGKYLIALPNGKVMANGPRPDTWETFTVEAMGLKTAFKTHHNTYLFADRAGNLNAKRKLGHGSGFSINCLGGLNG